MASSVQLIKHIIHINSLVERFGVNGIKKDAKAVKQVLLINLWYENIQYILLYTTESVVQTGTGLKNNVVAFSLDTFRHLFGHIFGQIKEKSKVAKHS